MTLEKIGKKMKKVKNDVKKKKEKNHGDNNRNIVNDTNISNDTIRFLELLAIRLPHKSPSSSTALQLLMTACDSIQGTEVSKEISNNPKHCLSIFENAFNKKENDNDLNNNSNNNTITSNTLINIDNIRKLIKKDTIITSIDNLINIVKANNFNENRYSLVQEMVKYYKNSDSKRSTKEDKFVTILNEKFLSFIVFSTNNNSDTDDCCIWGYIVAMTINNSNNTKNIKKLASTFNLMAIDNSKAIFMGMGFLGFWGICLNIYEYDDNKFSQLIKLFSSLLTAYLQSLHINGSNDSIIDIEMLILHPIILRCWLSKIKANSSSINELQDIILRYLLVVAQSTDNVWNILHPVLEDTEMVKIDKDVINRGYLLLMNTIFLTIIETTYYHRACYVQKRIKGITQLVFFKSWNDR
jgi:hypothetical protein